MLALTKLKKCVFAQNDESGLFFPTAHSEMALGW